VANSRRRERELARRRYERRRLREQQVRARRRRRNTILGATAGVVVVLGLLGWGIYALSSGGGKKAVLKPAASSTPTPTPTISTPPAAAPTTCAAIKPNPPAKGDPSVPPVKGKVPTHLVVKDLKVGSGAKAKKGAKLSMNYVGVSCDTGKAFDASYPRHTPFNFTLGQGQVIQGWDKGIVGMRVGGRRELIIPAAEGYGSQSQPGIPANDTLIFVVDLLKA
jgi:peptidylprolyl isomerase